MFTIDVKVKKATGQTKAQTIMVDIKQDGRKFYTVVHTWYGVKQERQAEFDAIIGELMGQVGITGSGDGTMGPISEAEMVEFEIGLTVASKAFNQLAIADAKAKNRDMAAAERAMAKL